MISTSKQACRVAAGPQRISGRNDPGVWDGRNPEMVGTWVVYANGKAKVFGDAR